MTTSCQPSLSGPFGVLSTYTLDRPSAFNASLHVAPPGDHRDARFYWSSDGHAMSALGQKQTCALHQPMSALPPNQEFSELRDWFAEWKRGDGALNGY